jgi:c-di-GMP-binding flagellar brake protein YcgR
VIDKNTLELPFDKPVKGLRLDEVPVGVPLAWPIGDDDGTVLLDRNAVLPNIEARDFLFRHFRPYRDDLIARRTVVASGYAENKVKQLVSIEEMRLVNGHQLGVRYTYDVSNTTYSSRLIGFAPNRCLLITQPLLKGESLAPELRENIEILAISGECMYRFVCSVEAICTTPFNYIVLSEPGVIRQLCETKPSAIHQLRQRKSERIPIKTALRYSTNIAGNTYEGVAIVRDISPIGMAFSAMRVLGSVGERLRVAFRIQTNELDVEVRAIAIIRNLQQDMTDEALVLHGVEFLKLEPAQDKALKTFVLDRRYAAIH